MEYELNDTQRETEREVEREKCQKIINCDLQKNFTYTQAKSNQSEPKRNGTTSLAMIRINNEPREMKKKKWKKSENGII